MASVEAGGRLQQAYPDGGGEGVRPRPEGVRLAAWARSRAATLRALPSHPSQVGVQPWILPTRALEPRIGWTANDLGWVTQVASPPRASDRPSLASHPPIGDPVRLAGLVGESAAAPLLVLREVAGVPRSRCQPERTATARQPLLRSPVMQPAPCPRAHPPPRSRRVRAAGSRSCEPAARDAM